MWSSVSNFLISASVAGRISHSYAPMLPPSVLHSIVAIDQVPPCLRLSPLDAKQSGWSFGISGNLSNFIVHSLFHHTYDGITGKVCSALSLRMTPFEKGHTVVLSAGASASKP